MQLQKSAVVTALSLALGLLAAHTAHAAVVLSTLGSAYTQNFDTLASSGASGTLPDGWFLSETGTNANTSYSAGTGSLSTGNTYSFGAAGSTERALGGVRSGALAPTIGAAFDNSTGSLITGLSISYTGEQWRAGATLRYLADQLDFQYSLDATSLTTGTWIDVDALDFASPNIRAAEGLLDGNAAANRSDISSTISGLSIANGSSIWLRWNDFNIAGSDDGLAIDDFSLTASGATVPEPGSLALAGLALLALARSRRQR